MRCRKGFMNREALSGQSPPPWPRGPGQHLQKPPEVAPFTVPSVTGLSTRTPG